MKIVLVGMMGAGKTAVGEGLARRLGVPLLDTDALVEASAGMSIAQIFEREGEEGFRRKERRAVARAAALENLVIAAGGGAWMDEKNRELLLAGGARVIRLFAPAGELLRRLGDAGDRPLLGGLPSKENVEEIMGQREEIYSLAPEQVNTEGLAVDEVVSRIARGEAGNLAVGGDAVRVTVAVPDPYEVVVGSALRQKIPELLEGAGVLARRMGLASDHLVWTLYGEGARDRLEGAGCTVVDWQFPPGEASKSLNELGRAYDHFLEGGAERDFPLMALGGGVTGDLIGLAAATLLRGIPYVQVPTTLLAQVDSSVGGKVAVNHPRGKNLIGAFYQPRLVLCDVDFLRTLSGPEFLSGMGEVLKHGIITGGSYLNLLAEQGDRIMERDREVLLEVVAGSCRIKAGYVIRDEREGGVRRHLNFGHTLGHAVESASRGAIPHGVAVAFGMAAAARISRYEGHLSPGEARFIEDLLRSWGYPVSIGELPGALGADQLLHHLKFDKKRRDGRTHWVLLRAVGQPLVSGDVPEKTVLRALRGE